MSVHCFRMGRRRHQGTWVRVGLLFLIIFHVVLAAEWLSLDSQPLFWDMAEHAVKVVKVQHNLSRTTPPLRARLLSPEVRSFAEEHPMIARVLLAPVAGWSNLTESLYLGAIRPPLSYWPSALVLGSDEASTDEVAAAHGLIWLIALMMSTYLLGAALANRPAGLLAAALVSGYPLVVGQSRVPMLDIPLAAITVFSLWSLIRSQDFRHGAWALVFGASVGAGLLMKQSFPIGLALPVAWSVAPIFKQVWKNHDGLSDEIRERFRHVLHAIVAIFLVAGPWYLVNTPSTLRFLSRSREAYIVEGDPSSWTLEGLLYYPTVYWDVAMGPVLGIGALCGLAILVFAGTRRERSTVGLSLLGLLAVYVLIYPNKDARYIATTLPLLAIVTAGAVARIPFTLARRGVWILFFIFALATPVGTTRSSMIAGLTDSASLSELDRLFEAQSFYAHRPSSEHWPADQILDSIRSHHGNNVGKISLFIVDGSFFLPWAISLSEDREYLQWRDDSRVQYIESRLTDGSSWGEGPFYLLVEAASSSDLVSTEQSRARLAEMGLEFEALEVVASMGPIGDGGWANLFFYPGESTRP